MSLSFRLPVDLRYYIVAIAATKVGYKVSPLMESYR